MDSWVPMKRGPSRIGGGSKKKKCQKRKTALSSQHIVFISSMSFKRVFPINHIFPQS